MLYKEKQGRRIKPDIKGPTFGEATCDLKIENDNPGPGQYTVKEQFKSPSFTIATSGLLSRGSIK